MIYAENILICIAFPLIVTLLFLRKSARRFVSCFVIGMLVCLISAYINGFIDMLIKMPTTDTAIFISPMIEEIMKILPLLFYFLIFTPKEKDMLIAAIGIGAGFATFENCCYILTSGADKLPYVMIRGLAVGVMHIVCTIFVSVGLMILRRFKTVSIAGMFGALALSMTFHALYNLLVSEQGITSYIGYALPLLSVAVLYIPYKRYREEA